MSGTLLSLRPCVPLGLLTSIYMFPWSSEMAVRGSPLLRWSPSQFWDTTCRTWKAEHGGSSRGGQGKNPSEPSLAKRSQVQGRLQPHRKAWESRALVAHTCNPSYSRGRNQITVQSHPQVNSS
jgi:hypothetical protein